MRLREQYRATLQIRMLNATAAHDAVGDRVFGERREPKREEWAMMEEWQRKYDGYAELLNRFFRPREPEEPRAVEELLY